MEPILDSLSLHSIETEQISDSINNILASQTEIGWKYFIRERISIAFKSQLARYLRPIYWGRDTVYSHGTSKLFWDCDLFT